MSNYFPCIRDVKEGKKCDKIISVQLLPLKSKKSLLRQRNENREKLCKSFD